MPSILKDKSILVTGGTGSMGKEIVRSCLVNGARKVIVFSRDEIKHFILKMEMQDERLVDVIGDTREIYSVEKVFVNNEIDIIFHAAAMKHVVMCEDHIRHAVETNILGTQNVVDMAKKYRVPRMITISTDKAANPVNVMGASKFIAERVTLNAQRSCVKDQTFACVRFGNVAVSRGSVVPVYVNNLVHHKPILVTDYDVTRFMMEIPQAVSLVNNALEHAHGGEIFVLKMKAFRLGDMVDVILDKIAPRLNIKREEIAIKTTGLVRGEKLHENLINETELSKIYQLEDMYVILKDDSDLSRYSGISKVDLSNYASNNVPLINKNELERMIMEYLDTTVWMQ